jgi:hypothetical protein
VDHLLNQVIAGRDGAVGDDLVACG